MLISAIPPDGHLAVLEDNYKNPGKNNIRLGIVSCTAMGNCYILLLHRKEAEVV
jgi:hypothetical protein